MASTRHDGRNADSAAAIAAVAAATDADAEADTILAAGAVDGSDAAVAGAVSLAAEAVDAAIFDFAESIELDDEDVAEEVGEDGDGIIGVGGGPTPGPMPGPTPKRMPRMTPRPEGIVKVFWRAVVRSKFTKPKTTSCTAGEALACSYLATAKMLGSAVVLLFGLRNHRLDERKAGLNSRALPAPA